MSKRPLFILPGSIVKESWWFHGWMGGGLEGIQQFRNHHKTFRFVKHRFGIIYSEYRVNCMGWPVSGYEYEVISEKEMSRLIKDANYDEYYKVYRPKRWTSNDMVIV